MKSKSIAMLLGVLFFFVTSVHAQVLDISNPETGKVNIFVTAEEDTAQNKNFVDLLKGMLQASLLFQISNTQENADFSATLSGSVESQQMVAAISGSGESETIYQGLRFSNDSKNYVDLRAAQLGNQIISQLFGSQGSLGSSILFSIDEDEEGVKSKSIFKDTFGVPDSLEKVTYNFASNFSVAYSPDGRNIIYNSLTGKGNQIMVQQISPLKLTASEVYYNEGRSSAPFWAPDGTIFLTLHESERNSDIYKFSIPSNYASAENPQLQQGEKLTSDSAIETEPNISPDNKQMAYVSDKTGNPQIYIFDLETGKSNRLSKTGNNNTTPTWSPNGKFIAFTGIRGGVSSIYRIDVASGEETRVTPSEIQAESPTWSPDGSLIAFGGKKGSESSKIYYSLVNGRDYQRLTQSGSATIETEPSWGKGLR